MPCFAPLWQTLNDHVLCAHADKTAHASVQEYVPLEVAQLNVGSEAP